MKIPAFIFWLLVATFSIFTVTITLAVVFGPLVYSIVLQHYFHVNFDFNYANQFTNNVVSISAIALSIVAIAATLIGLYWQFQQTESSGELRNQIKEIRDAQKSDASGKRIVVTELPPQKNPGAYEKSVVQQGDIT